MVVHEGRRPVRAGACGVLLMCALVGHAQAQSRYTCRTEQGQVFGSGQPCPQDTRTVVVFVPPARPVAPLPAAPRTPDLPPLMPDYHGYMSPRCQSLDETLRRMPGKTGTPPDVLEGLRREYNAHCRDDEQRARSRLAAERQARERLRSEADFVAQQARQRTQAEQERHGQQCAESHRVLAAKRARTDLTDGEKNDLRRFEETVLVRCPR